MNNTVDHKNCLGCGRTFHRNARYSFLQWAQTAYCSRKCAGLSRQNRSVLAVLGTKLVINPATNCWEWTGATDTGGYGLVTLADGQNQKVHRAMMKALTGKEADKYVLHRCDNRKCCNPYHLFVGTQKDNVADMHMKGRAHRATGEDCPSSRLTEKQAIAIRDDTRTQAEIAADYGIAQTTVSAIKRRLNWSHV